MISYSRQYKPLVRTVHTGPHTCTVHRVLKQKRDIRMAVIPAANNYCNYCAGPSPKSAIFLKQQKALLLGVKTPVDSTRIERMLRKQFLCATHRFHHNKPAASFFPDSVFFASEDLVRSIEKPDSLRNVD